MDSLYFSSYMFGRMESIKLVGVLQEAEDADRRACTRSYFKLNISLIPANSTLIRLSHFYQEFCICCIVITSDGMMG